MQRVVRSSLVGLLAIAGLTACGDKVTVPPITTTPLGTVVHGVTVSPNVVTNLQVGAKVILAASVDADAGVTNRGVTWSSSNTAVATVGTDGTVTGVAVGTVTIIAASAADPTVKGAAAVTVIPAGGGALPPTVLIQVINQNPGGQPANLTNAFGQLDVVLNVDPNGQQLRSVSATFTCPGATTMTQTQTISAASPAVAAEASQALITLSFNTALFAPTTGVPTLRNGQCSLAATAVTGATGSTQTQTATTNSGLVLNNQDGVVITEAFATYTNAEGKTTLTTANDANGLPWKGGAVTVTALPVLYSGRTLTGGGTVTITLPGANGASQIISPTAAGPQTATWSATASSGSRVTGLTLVSANYAANLITNPTTACTAGLLPACEVNGVTPLGVTPTVQALDNAGNDLNLSVLNLTQPALNLPNPVFRLDNSAVQPPSFFSTPGRQVGWVNAAYTFTGPGGASFSAASGTTEYVSCGDGANGANQNGSPFSQAAPPVAIVAGGTYACSGTAGTNAAGQVGVSAAQVSSSSSSKSGGTNGQTTFSFYAMSAGTYASINTNGTSTSSTACSTTGWTAINTAGDLAEADATGNPFFIVRVFETDKLGNARCTDLAINGGASPNINTTTFAFGRFSVDKTPPTAGYVEFSAASAPTAASNSDALCAAAAPNVGQPCTRGLANFNIIIGLSDNASGFAGTPITAMITRLAVSPTTNLPSNAAGNFNSTFACPSGLDNNNVCTTKAYASSVPGDGGVAGTANQNDASGCASCGYFTFSQTPMDQARNLATTVTGTATPTITGAFSAAPGQRQVVIDLTPPVSGGIAVPASIIGGTSASFATNATDNLDLVKSDYTLTYSATPAGNPIGNLPIRAAGVALGVAFDNVLTTSSSFNIVVPFFIRSIATTTAAPGNAPQNNGGGVGGGLPISIANRIYDAANNASLVNPATNNGFSNIGAANVPQTNATNFTAAPAGANAGAVMSTFAETNTAVSISNCAGTGATPCPGGVASANATSVTLTAQATGVTSANPSFQFVNPFSQVQFYYFDTSVGEYVLIGTAVAPVVTDPVLPLLGPPAVNGVRAFTWTLATPFDPPAILGGAAGGIPLSVIAVGVNTPGDALATAVNTNIALTIP